MKNSKSIKIAYLSDSFIPSTRANTVHVIKMCAAFAECGAETVLYGNSEGLFDLNDIFKKYAVTNMYKIVVEESHVFGKFRLIDYAFKKAKDVKKQNPDICYGRSLLSIFLLRNHFPFIYESHIKPNRRLFIWLEKKILKHKNFIKLIVISKNLKNEYLKMFPFLQSEDIIVLHDGADMISSGDMAERIPEKLLMAHKDGITIGYIGHLYPGKCMETLIPVAKVCKELRFHIIGGTEKWVNHWIDECHKEKIENIEFYGYIDYSVVNSCYQNIDIVILPFSNEIYFNKDKKDDIGKWISPLKLFEAMANGKAIISSDLPSIEEIITDNVNGILVPAEEPMSWKKAIYTLINDNDKRITLGNRAKQIFEEKYTWKKRAEKVLSIIENR